MKYMQYQKLVSIILISVMWGLFFVALCMADTTFTLVVLGILIVLFIVGSRIKKKQAAGMTELLSIYLDDCDPIQFIERASSVVDSKWTIKRNKYYLQLMNVNALYDVGNINESNAAFQRIDLEKAKRGSYFENIIVCPNEALYFLRNGEIKKAEDIYRKVNMYIQKHKKLRKNKKIEAWFKSHEAHVSYHKGLYDACYDFYLEVYSGSESRLKDKVMAAYRLGTIDETRDKQSAEAYFSFAAENGNRMNVVNLAKAKIKELALQ